MLATLLLNQSPALALSCALLAMLSAWLSVPVRWGHPALVRAVASGAAGSGAFALAWALARAATGTALLLLLLLTAALALATTLRGVRRAGRTQTHLLALRGLRLLAWAAVIVLVAQPVWESVRVEWRRPLLVALLDQSQSMALRTGRPEQPDQPRVELARQKLAEARAALPGLDRLYDVRIFGVGSDLIRQAEWTLRADQPFSALASALALGGQQRDLGGRRPAALVMLSDGGENVATAEDLRAAAAGLADHGVALVAVGVGPEPGSTPTLDPLPLNLPARVGTRALLRIEPAAHARACTGHSVSLELLWNGRSAATQRLSINSSPARVSGEFEQFPPGPGVQRLTVRWGLPAELGGGSVEVHRLVEVEESQISVLLVEGTPRSESAFLSRTLSNDPQIQFARRYALHSAGRPGLGAALAPDAWRGYDVIILADVAKWRLSARSLLALRDAVDNGGAGLLISLNSASVRAGELSGTPLEVLSPVEFRFGARSGAAHTVTPTLAGRNHPILAGVPFESLATSQLGSGLTDRALPALTLLEPGQHKPAAQVVLSAGDAGPALLVHEFGAGRVAASTWEATWPWALASDRGAAVHQRLWRNLVAWLANRRPQAWIVTDQSRYASAALARGQQQVRIRAGVSGVGEPAAADGVARLTIRRVLDSATQPLPTELTLVPVGSEWRCTLPEPGRDVFALGEYELEFRATRASMTHLESPASAQADGAPSETLIARTRFRVIETDLERQPPTSNLALLRQAADATAAAGGRYLNVTDLPGVLQELATVDRRERVATRLAFDPTRHMAWWLLALLVAALGAEWWLRRRSGYGLPGA